MTVGPLVARSGDVTLAGSLWLPDAPPVALVVMHPGSGPSDRHNDVFFPPIRAALLGAGVAVASFDKRGVGGSGGSWLEAGIAEQATDLLAGLAAASSQVPGVPAGLFGHSQGGWVVLAALAAPDGHESVRPAFGVTSSGPAVTVGQQERYSGRRQLERLELAPSDRARAIAAADGFLGLAEAGASHAQVLAWAAEPVRAGDIAFVSRLFGDDLPDRHHWDLLVRLAAFDPAPALRAIHVPLLAVFGEADRVTPVEASVAAL